MSAFPKAAVQSVPIGIELMSASGRKRTFRNVSRSSEWENSNGSSPRPRTYDSSVRKGVNCGEFLPQISHEPILTS